MVRSGALILACMLLWPVLLTAQSESGVASSEDISVADGLQLPNYGHMWALDTWKGVDELVQFAPADAETSEFGIRWSSRHSLEIKGERARIRVHSTTPQLFLHGVSDDETSGQSIFAMVRLSVTGQRRVASKEAVAAVNGKGAASPDVVPATVQRVGATDWYRITPMHALEPGEYVLAPLKNAPAAAAGDVYDFAVDPTAPENARPLRSEENRQSD